MMTLDSTSLTMEPASETRPSNGPRDLPPINDKINMTAMASKRADNAIKIL
jgi:hypothetical protein